MTTPLLVSSRDPNAVTVTLLLRFTDPSLHKSYEANKEIFMSNELAYVVLFGGGFFWGIHCAMASDANLGALYLASSCFYYLFLLAGFGYALASHCLHYWGGNENADYCARVAKNIAKVSMPVCATFTASLLLLARSVYNYPCSSFDAQFVLPFKFFSNPSEE